MMKASRDTCPLIIHIFYIMTHDERLRYHHGYSETDAFKWRQKSQCIERLGSNLLKLRRFDQRVRLRDLFTTGRFEVEGASMDLGVPVDPAVSRPAPALESGQPDPFPARRATIRPFQLLLLRRRQPRRSHRHRSVLRRYIQFSWWILNERWDRRRRDGSDLRRRRGRYGGERWFDGGFHGGLLLLLETEIAVAIGAEIHGGGASEEAAVVSAETVAFRRLTSMLFRHRSWEFLIDQARRKSGKKNKSRLKDN